MQLVLRINYAGSVGKNYLVMIAVYEPFNTVTCCLNFMTNNRHLLANKAIKKGAFSGIGFAENAYKSR